MSKFINLQSLILAVLPIFAVSPASADVNHVYLENDGYVQFQVEDAETAGDWTLATEIDGYTGSGYFEWTGSNYFSQSNAGNGTILYHFRVETAGNYELRWRSRIAKGDINTESNDSWVRLSTGTNVVDEEPISGWTKVFMGETGTWTWSARTADHGSLKIRQYFGEGDHSLEISGRSYGHAIDKIALFRYEDVNFDAGHNGTLPLSRIISLDGTIVDPNITAEPEPEPEVVLSGLVNAEPIAEEDNAQNAPFCLANTLTLSASKFALLSTTNQTVLSTINELVLKPDEQALLLSYELSLLPVFTAAALHYTTGLQASNGSLSVYLGSHNEWPDKDAADAPNAIVKIADAAGGWNSETLYSSTLDATLLPREESTLILSSLTGSDDLSFGNPENLMTLPRLIITGGNEFCSNWEANILESKQEPEDNNTTTPDTSDIDTSSTNTTNTDPTASTSSRSGLGGTSVWFAILLGAALSRKLQLTRNQKATSANIR